MTTIRWPRWLFLAAPILIAAYLAVGVPDDLAQREGKVKKTSTGLSFVESTVVQATP